MNLLFEALSGTEPVLILTHNDPDPDAVAGAVALRYLLAEKGGITSIIGYHGIIGRAENKALIAYLGNPLKLLTGLEFLELTPAALIDTQPGTGNNTVPLSSRKTMSASDRVSVSPELFGVADSRVRQAVITHSRVVGCS